MNTNETKAKIWNICIEKGIFSKVKGEDFKKIQEIFERIIKGYEQLEPSTEIFNKIIDSISFEIQNQGQDQNQIQENKVISSTAFENIQKEYNEMLNTPIPKKIDFSMGNMDLEIPTQIQNQNQNQNQVNSRSQIRLEEIIMTQNKILIQILETQVKIIEALKK